MISRADLFYKAQRRSAEYLAKLTEAVREVNAARYTTTDKGENESSRQDKNSRQEVSICEG